MDLPNQVATKPPWVILWSDLKTTISLLESDWRVPGEVSPQYLPIRGEFSGVPIEDGERVIGAAAFRLQMERGEAQLEYRRSKVKALLLSEFCLKM